MKKSRKKRAPKRLLALPDLELAKSAVLNSLTSTSAKRTWYRLSGSGGHGASCDPADY